jgi:DNA-binding CsgD family transcriptional regulator
LGKDYYSRFFNEDDAKNYVPKMIEMMERNNPEEIYSFFQQVRSSPAEPWSWYLSSSRILLNDHHNKPLLLITFAVPIDPLQNLTSKVSRVLEENDFVRHNLKKFSTLSKREKEIAKQLALGGETARIAESLHISIDTLKTHRKNIYKKLHINSIADLLHFARAFELI